MTSTDDQIRTMTATELTTLAFTLGLAPKGVAPSAADPHYYYDARGFPWVPALDVTQARAVFFDWLGELGFGVYYRAYKAAFVLQAFPPGHEDDVALFTRILCEGGTRTGLALAMLRAACRAVAARKREEAAP